MNWSLVVAIFVFLLICISIYDMHKIKLAYYHLQSNKINNDVKMVFLSDLHNHKFGYNNDRLLKKINECHPDFILIGGDMLTARPNKKNRTAMEFIRQLTKIYEVYYAFGNHEYRAKIYPETYSDMYQEYMEYIKNEKLHVLNNESIVLEKNHITISGLSIDKEYYKRTRDKKKKELDVNQNLGENDFSFYQILLAHNPEYFEDYDKWMPDLTLSGHFHGGIIRIPGIGGLISASLHFFPKYDGGLYRGRFGSFIISRGLGMHTIPIRIGNPCELVCIEILKE